LEIILLLNAREQIKSMKQTTFLANDRHLTKKVAVASLTRVFGLWSNTICPPHCKDQQS